ncbi:MAG: tRNA lysidine(34) synthetase TilS [Thiohalocapsa sp.]
MLRSADLNEAVLRVALAPELRINRLWIAYSGGLDSSVLLQLVTMLGRQSGLKPRAIHIDHGLHRQSAQWAEHCRSQCARLGVPLTVRALGLRRGKGESLEALARTARYEVFAGLLDAGDALATGQTRDDQAETLLLALLRGSGVQGLASMPARKPLGAGHLVRPLLEFSRSDLRVYAEHERLCWIEDPSNADPRFDRNLLRNRILPLLRPRWPALDATLSRSAAHCAEAASLLDEFADELLSTVSGSRTGTLSIRQLAGLSGRRRRLLLRRWLVREGLTLPDRHRLRRIDSELIPAAPDRAPVVAWKGCEVRRYCDDLYALSPLPPPPTQALNWDPSGPLALPGELGRLTPPRASEAFVTLGVCFRRPGLRCRAAGAHSRSLKYLFQDAGVPGWVRPYVPLVLVDGELGAVAGVRDCDARLAGVGWRGHPWERFGFISGG